MLFESVLRYFHGDEAVDAFIAQERAKAEAEAAEGERVVLAEWHAAEAAGTLHLMLPPDEL